MPDKGFQDKTEKDIKELYSHADIANREMGEVKRDIAWLRDWAKNIDMKLWGIMAAILTGLIRLFIK